VFVSYTAGDTVVVHVTGVRSARGAVRRGQDHGLHGHRQGRQDRPGVRYHGYGYCHTRVCYKDRNNINSVSEIKKNGELVESTGNPIKKIIVLFCLTIDLVFFLLNYCYMESSSMFIVCLLFDWFQRVSGWRQENQEDFSRLRPEVHLGGDALQQVLAHLPTGAHPATHL